MPVEIKLLDHPETAFLTSDSAYFTTPAPGARSHVLCALCQSHTREVRCWCALFSPAAAISRTPT